MSYLSTLATVFFDPPSRFIRVYSGKSPGRMIRAAVQGAGIDFQKTHIVTDLFHLLEGVRVDIFNDGIMGGGRAQVLTDGENGAMYRTQILHDLDHFPVRLSQPQH